MDHLISIGKMAEVNHTTVATLRLYDKKNLLKPRFTDPQTGYRYYSTEQNYRLDMITYMKDLGMSLGEIEAVFRREDITLIEDILSRKNEQLHQQIRRLKSRHDAVERAIESIERYRKSPTNGHTTLEYIDRRRVWGIPATSNFYEEGLQDYEKQLNNLHEQLLAKGVSQVHSYNVMTSIRQGNFLAGRYIPDRLLIEADGHFEFPEETSCLDAGMYACIYLDNFDGEKAYAERLRAYCDASHYQICGDYLCEVMTEFHVFDSEKRSMYLRLQVPVKFS